MIVIYLLPMALMLLIIVVFTRLRNINGIQVMGHPEACVVAIQSSEFNIYKLSDGMSRRGWSLNPLQFPFRYVFEERY